jgi:biotin carboxyl carrier protein
MDKVRNASALPGSCGTEKEAIDMAKYTTRAAGREAIIETREDGSVVVNGAVVDAELYRTRQGLFLRTGTRIWSLNVLDTTDDSGLRYIAVNGRVIPVEVDDETSALLRSLQTDKATRVHHAMLRSPMPGRIARMLVNEGELIEAGQGVLILEAMKMENEIKAPSTGIVKSVLVKEGDAVEKNALLIEIS